MVTYPIGTISEQLACRRNKDFLLQPSLVAFPRPGRDRAEVAGSSECHPLEEALSLAAYRARYFLRVPPRLLSDLWFSFQDMVAPVAPPTSSPITAASNAPVPNEADRRDSVLEMLRRQCKEPLGREPRLLPPQRHRLIGLLSMDPEGEWIFPGGAFQLYMSFVSQRAFAVPAGEQMPPATRTIQVREVSGWGLSAQPLTSGGEPSSTAQYLTAQQLTCSSCTLTWPLSIPQQQCATLCWTSGRRASELPRWIGRLPGDTPSMCGRSRRSPPFGSSTCSSAVGETLPGPSMKGHSVMSLWPWFSSGSTSEPPYLAAYLLRAGLPNSTCKHSAGKICEGGSNGCLPMLLPKATVSLCPCGYESG